MAFDPVEDIDNLRECDYCLRSEIDAGEMILDNHGCWICWLCELEEYSKKDAMGYDEFR